MHHYNLYHERILFTESIPLIQNYPVANLTDFVPEVAWVGLTEEQVRTAGINYEVGRCSFYEREGPNLGVPRRSGQSSSCSECPTKCCWAYIL